MTITAESVVSLGSDVSTDDAYEYCRRITRRHGANFSVGFRFLPPEKQRAVHAAYAFCRWADDIADEPGSNIEERLDACQNELDATYAGSPSNPITIALADSLARFEIPHDAFVALIDGCRQDLWKSRYATFDELLRYCDLVATSISDISLSIFGYRTDRAKEYGRNLSTALQLTNVTRDVADDLPRDRIYLPLEELERFGVTENDVVERRRSPQMRALLEFQIDRALDYFRRAEPLLGELSFDARFPVLLMGSVYSTVLKRLRRDPFLSLGPRISLPARTKIAVVMSRLLRPRFV